MQENTPKTILFDNLIITAKTGFAGGFLVEMLHFVASILDGFISGGHFLFFSTIVQYLIYLIFGGWLLYHLSKKIISKPYKALYFLSGVIVWFLCLTVGSVFTYALMHL